MPRQFILRAVALRPPIDRLTRREFVQESLAVGAGMLLSTRATATTRRTSTRTARNRRGGWLCGLACASELRSGLRRRRSRSADRVGGRVHTLTDFVPGKTVEAGGEFVGSNHPTWLAYAKRFQLRWSTCPRRMTSIVRS